MNLPQRHVSDSLEQRDAETFMLEKLRLSLRIGGEALDQMLPLGLKPDWINVEARTLIEVYAHLGALKGSQRHKVKGDILKLIFLELRLGGAWRKILCFADEKAASAVKGKSWLAEAVREFDVEVHVVGLSEHHEKSVLAAQMRQKMVNPEVK